MMPSAQDRSVNRLFSLLYSWLMASGLLAIETYRVYLIFQSIGCRIYGFLMFFVFADAQTSKSNSWWPERVFVTKVAVELESRIDLIASIYLFTLFACWLQDRLSKRRPHSALAKNNLIIVLTCLNSYHKQNKQCDKLHRLHSLVLRDKQLDCRRHKTFAFWH